MATPPVKQEPVGFTPYFGGFILETLTVGMYGEARNAIREYIQNGFDSIQRARPQASHQGRGQDHHHDGGRQEEPADPRRWRRPAGSERGEHTHAGRRVE